MVEYSTRVSSKTLSGLILGGFNSSIRANQVCRFAPSMGCELGPRHYIVKNDIGSKLRDSGQI